jgi:hypothetical protein
MNNDELIEDLISLELAFFNNLKLKECDGYVRSLLVDLFKKCSDKEIIEMHRAW